MVEEEVMRCSDAAEIPYLNSGTSANLIFAREIQYQNFRECNHLAAQNQQRKARCSPSTS